MPDSSGNENDPELLGQILNTQELIDQSFHIVTFPLSIHVGPCIGAVLRDGSSATNALLNLARFTQHCEGRNSLGYKSEALISIIVERSVLRSSKHQSNAMPNEIRDNVIELE